MTERIFSMHASTFASPPSTITSPSFWSPGTWIVIEFSLELLQLVATFADDEAPVDFRNSRIAPNHG
jgi:hypothetical protein